MRYGPWTPPPPKAADSPRRPTDRPTDDKTMSGGSSSNDNNMIDRPIPRKRKHSDAAAADSSANIAAAAADADAADDDALAVDTANNSLPPSADNIRDIDDDVSGDNNNIVIDGDGGNEADDVANHAEQQTTTTTAAEARAHDNDDVDDGIGMDTGGVMQSATAESADGNHCNLVNMQQSEQPPPPIPHPPAAVAYPSLRRAIVTNDGSSQNLIHLIGLKSLFAKQLPKMPKEYIARLVFDRHHVSLALLSSDESKRNTDEEIIGGICYRPYPDMRFGEIAFCAVSASQQVKGYGSKLMNLAKMQASQHDGVEYFITYADNYAIG